MQTSTQALAAGTLIQGRYQIQRVLGQGGMSRVYLATDLRLSLRVAVKENLQAYPEARDQFRREAQILAHLSHPNLPRVIDHFDDPATGRQYLVMDYVEGEDLESMVKRVGPLPEATAVGLIQQVLGALEYLHSQQPPVIHRDIKPSNIKVTPQGKAVLVDFGIAKGFDTEGRTLEGARAATPGYAPPEQYGYQTDERSDVYAAGATLYTLVTGQTPPESTLRMANSAPFISPRAFRPDLSPNVERAILVALELDTSRRWPHAGTFRAALTAPVGPPAGPTVAAQTAAAPYGQTAAAAYGYQGTVQTPLPAYPSQPAHPTPLPALPAEKPRSGRNIWPVLFALLAGAVLAAGGFFIYINGGIPGDSALPASDVAGVVATTAPSATLDQVGTTTAIAINLLATGTVKANVNGTQTAAAPSATLTKLPTRGPTNTPRVGTPVIVLLKSPTPIGGGPTVISDYLAPTNTPAAPTKPPAAAPTRTRVPPSATPIPASPTPAPPTATPSPAVAPGIYVTGIRLDPPNPNRGNQITFYVTFLNTTGGPSNMLWKIRIFDPDKPRNDIGSTTPQQISLPPGTSVQSSNATWGEVGPGDCVSRVARAAYQNADLFWINFNDTNANMQGTSFQVCPAL